MSLMADSDRRELEFIEELLNLMTKKKCLRVAAGGVELELSPQAFAMDSKTLKTMAADGVNDVCRCGHSMTVEHSETGCLAGCSTAMCLGPDSESDSSS